MEQSSRAASAFADSQLDNVLDEIAEQIQRGQPVDIEVYAQRHPNYAERLRELLPTLEALACSLRQESAERQAAADGESPPASVRFKISEFEIIRELGRGGMGIVYEAYQPSVNRKVALKVLPFAALLDPDQIKRFRFEAEIAAKLDHPNIVNVYSAGKDPDKNIHYFAMEFVEGPTIAEVIAHMRKQAGDILPDDPDTNIADTYHSADQSNQSPIPSSGNGEHLGSTLDETFLSVHGLLSPGDDNRTSGYLRAAVRLIADAARGLDYAHRAGVIHRDIKPANLMIDDDGSVIVTDFGLARIECDVHLTNAYKLMGTLPYMSPEQAFAERAAFDHRSDVYSLGATLYELLTLRKLIVAQDPPGILRAIAEEQPLSPRKLNKAIPRDLENIVLMATQKDPLDRYATAEHFAEDLERFLSGQQALAEQVGLVARGRRWLRRPSRIALVIIFAMNIIAAILLAVWGFQLAKREAELDLRESSRANTRSRFRAEDFGDAAFIAIRSD